MKMQSLYKTVLLLVSVFLFSCSDEEVSKDDELERNPNSKLLFDNVGGKAIIIIGNPGSDFIVSFEHKLSNGRVPQLEIVEGKLPILMADEQGNEYNIFGQVVNGADAGEYLLPILSYQSYWFAIAAHFPGIEIHGVGSEQVNPDLDYSNTDWLIPTNNIFAGSSFDAIASVDNPQFINVNESGPNIDADIIPDQQDLVIGIIEGGEPKAFPHNILNWHEIVNQVIEQQSVTVTFCPLTGTAIGWKNKQETNDFFGVSGLLYNSNLLAFDKITGKNVWSQMLAKCVHGELKGQKLEVINVVETTWGTWSTMYPETRLMTENTGFTRDYDRTPYTGYIEDHDILYYPVDYLDDRLPNKERVHAVIINEIAKVYTMASFN